MDVTLVRNLRHRLALVEQFDRPFYSPLVHLTKPSNRVQGG